MSAPPIPTFNRRTLLATAGVVAALVAAPVIVPSATAASHASEISLADHQARLKSAAVADGTVRYLDLGPADGRAVMLLHGIPTSSYLWRHVAPVLAERGYRVLAPDVLGAGASDKPKGAGIYSSDKQAERLFAVADAAGVETFVPVLHDVGGMIGWEMVIADPARLDGLVATNTLIELNGVTPSPTVMTIMGGQATPDAVFGKLDDPVFATQATREWLDQGWVGSPAPDALVEAYAADLRDGGAAPYAAFFSEVVPRFMSTGEQRTEALSKFGKPTAIVFGERDGFFDADTVIPDLQAALGTPDANVTRIPDAGHFTPERTPDALVAAIDAFMKTLPAN